MSAVLSNETDENFAEELPNGTELMLGQYKIDSYLNHGGFGITYMATDSLNRKVVVKECFPGTMCRRSRLAVEPRSRAHVNEMKGLLKLFIREARALSKLEHPNIVGVHQVFEDHGTAYMILDFIEGSDLLNYIDLPDHNLTPAQVKSVLNKVLDALAFVHNAGLLHRDISPDNIILTPELEPKLIDFGAAREQATKATQALSALRVVKDGYSPQEFYLAGSTQSPSSDLYSLAATFYHIITGETPPDSQIRLTARVGNEPDPYVSLSEKTTEYDAAFCDAIDKALSVLPKDRIQSAPEWQQLLNEASQTKKPVRKEKAVKQENASSRLLSKKPAVVSKPKRAVVKRRRAGAQPMSIAATIGAFVILSGGTYFAQTNQDSATTGSITTIAPEEIASASQTDLPAVTQNADADPVAVVQPTVSAVSEATSAPSIEPYDLTALDDTWADGLVNLQWNVDLPFTASDEGKVLDVRGETLTIEAGQRLTQVNGTVIEDGLALNVFIREEALSSNGIAVSLNLNAVDTLDESEVQSQIAAPISYWTTLANGLAFQSKVEGDAWVASVVAAPEVLGSELKVGDEIVAHVSSKERIKGGASLARIFASEINDGNRSAKFAIRRGETLWIANVDLPGDAE